MEWSFPTDSNARPGLRTQTVTAGTPEGAPPATMESGQPAVEYALAVPANYTARYSYPLVVWFHDEGADERDVLEWLPRLSPQNYLGLGLRGPLPVCNGLPGERTWSTGAEHLQWLEDQLALALIEIAGQYSLHVERIVAAGIGHGGTMALQMMLQRPDLFAAAAGLNATLPTGFHLDQWGQYAGRSLWLGHSRLLQSGQAQPAMAAVRMLHAAGFEVHPRSYSADEWPLDTVGHDIDAWLLPTLCGDTVIA